MSTQHSPIHPGSGYASPAGSVLLPPVEIEVSPAHSYRSSSSSFRRHYSDDSSSDELDNTSKDPPQRRPTKASSSFTTSATTVQAGNIRTSNTFTKTFATEATSSVMSFTRKGEIEEYESNSHLYGLGMLRKSGSKQSITLKEYGYWGRLRRSPNFILFTVFLALFVDMATVGELKRRLFVPMPLRHIHRKRMTILTLESILHWELFATISLFCHWKHSTSTESSSPSSLSSSRTGSVVAPPTQAYSSPCTPSVSSYLPHSLESSATLLSPAGRPC